MARVIVSFPTHNRLEYTKICLPRVIEECKLSKHDVTLCVFDDDSTDGTKEYLKTLKGIDHLIFNKVGNTVWQFNYCLDHKDIYDYIYCMANDILMPEGIIDEMVKIMDSDCSIVSAMVQECKGLPYIRDYKLEEHSHTSSLGIHRIKLFDYIGSSDRFFGFQPYQEGLVKRGLKAIRVKGIGNTNLDMSAWSRQYEYGKKGYARTGLVGNKRSVYKLEQDNPIKGSLIK